MAENLSPRKDRARRDEPGHLTPIAREEDCSPGCGCTAIGRREFLQIAGLSAATVSAAARSVVAGPFSPQDTADHFVPADKKLSPEWVEALFAKGERIFYEGSDLATIAMPIGGLCAGQLYLAGDGRLVHWDVFNRHNFTGYGRDNYQLGREPAAVLQQGFAVTVWDGEKHVKRTLDAEGFPAVRFCGEYPIGTVEYRDPELPVEITLSAFSPFIPLDEEDSALPATVMEFTVTNRSQAKAEVTLGGWLENGVCLRSAAGMYGARRNAVVTRDGITMLLCSAKAGEPPEKARPTIVLADFEGDGYGDWTVEGEAFGTGPARGTIGKQQPVSGFLGKGLVNTFLGGSDQPHGKLTSPEFTIERSFISFLVGGGNHEGKTCMNLVVDGEVVRTAHGANNEKLAAHNWDVRELEGKKGRLEIVDRESGGWGHINIDHIEMSDRPRPVPRGALEEQPDYGTMALVLLDPTPEAAHTAWLVEGPPAEKIFAPGAGPDEAELVFGEPLVGALFENFALGPGEEKKVKFFLAWCFPNRDEQGERRGNFYANRFRSAGDVARYVAENYDRLADQTRLWHQTWYDSTLPHWLLDRLFSTVSTLATSTCQWWANGRFWAWEGVGCCRGTCTHVWNYEHAMARLFPRLERSAREMQDFNPEAGFDEETGMVRFRGENWSRWAGDGQAGTVLKAYREHLVSADVMFLKNNWPRIKKTLEFLINEDQNGDGLLEGAQHNTYDIDFYGPNTMVGSLYLAALRAGEEMARELGEEDAAARYRAIFESGRRLSAERLFDGEYFVQKVDLAEHSKHQYADGCLADQLFGQGWAVQVGLGYVYPEELVKKTLQSIWKYDWAPDVGPQNKAHPPERWFAHPGEAGLFTCTWPKSPHLAEGVRYRDEIWTGIEYQVAGNMASEGMLTEALAICRGVHERYHPAKHNPWNEIECGDHYARGMASYGVFLALCGFECHGPGGHLGFAPRITPDDFRAAFTAAEGWGTISQRRAAGRQTNHIEVLWGSLRVKTLSFELPDGANLALATVEVAGQPAAADAAQDGRRVTITLADAAVAQEGTTINVTLTT